MSDTPASTAPNPMNVDVLFPSKYLKCADLKGSPKILTITAVVAEDVAKRGGKKSREVVLSFAKTKKLLIVGKTNAQALALLLTSEFDKLVGHKIRLTPDITRWGSDSNVPCIRILGSPDATPERAAAYDRAWRSGDRKGGELVDRLKRERARIEVQGAAIPATAPPEPEPSEPSGAPPEPDIFAEDAPDPENVMAECIADASTVADCLAIGTELANAKTAGTFDDKQFGQLDAQLKARMKALSP